ncbi:MAG: hypothetical protein FWE36_06360 [Erysipelotrichales bacterium]|nr:hypothetical protein [Erysipelotrichales bacterium]
MKKYASTAIVILSVSLAMVFLGAVLTGVDWGTGFNGAPLADALLNIGYIGAILSGIVLTGIGVSAAVRSDGK